MIVLRGRWLEEIEEDSKGILFCFYVLRSTLVSLPVEKQKYR